MVILQRNELRRHRLLAILTIMFAVVILYVSLRQYSQSSEVMQLLLSLLGLAALAAIVIALIQLYSFPRRSHALIIHNDEQMILATNALHEGFKLRFLRDVLGEHVYSLSDGERAKLKALEGDGYFPALLVKGVRKVFLMRLCTMIFDDVFIVDRADRWEHHDSSSTSEPSYHKREMPPLRAWKRTSDISA
jgi:hypothetical protein